MCSQWIRIHGGEFSLTILSPSKGHFVCLVCFLSALLAFRIGQKHCTALQHYLVILTRVDRRTAKTNLCQDKKEHINVDEQHPERQSAGVFDFIQRYDERGAGRELRYCGLFCACRPSDAGCPPSALTTSTWWWRPKTVCSQVWSTSSATTSWAGWTGRTRAAPSMFSSWCVEKESWEDIFSF